MKLTAVITPPSSVRASLTPVQSVLPPKHLMQELESLKHRVAELEQVVGDPDGLAFLTDFLNNPKEIQNEET